MLIESLIIFFGMLLVAASNFFSRLGTTPAPLALPAPDVPEWIRNLYVFPFRKELYVNFNLEETEYIQFNFHADDGYQCFFGWTGSEITGFGDTALEAFQDALRRHLQAGFSDRYLREIQANLETLTDLFEPVMSYHDPAYKPIHDAVYAEPKRTSEDPES